MSQPEPSPSAQQPETSEVVLDRALLRRKVMGCWLGKAVGGTLGQSCEGAEGPLDFDFYDPVPTEMVPNDDLDLQVVWACVLAAQDRPRVDRHTLARAWADHVRFPWNEYGAGKRNHAEGIVPPYTGSFDNWFTCGEGAAIRSELWACLAPGDPDRAADLTYEDACFDHAGDGVLAAQFNARMQALAFVENDLRAIVDASVAWLPPSDLRDCLVDTLGWIDQGLHWTDIRTLVMQRHGRDDFTDVRHNTAFVLVGLLCGSTFTERILITNNCGEDTDSSTATTGATLGIFDPDGIEQRWLDPIGHALVLNDAIVDLDHPADLDGFTDLVLELGTRLDDRIGPDQEAEFDPAQHVIRVEAGVFNTLREQWSGRDITGLPPAGAAMPVVDTTPTTLPGTWVRKPAADFGDRLLLVRYPLNGHGRRDVRLMFNCTVDHRIWLDGEFLHAAQGTQLMFPSPHSTPVGQFVDFELDDGPHDLAVVVKRPDDPTAEAEWVIGLAERPSMLWIPHAFVANDAQTPTPQSNAKVAT